MATWLPLKEFVEGSSPSRSTSSSPCNSVRLECYPFKVEAAGSNPCHGDQLRNRGSNCIRHSSSKRDLWELESPRLLHLLSGGMQSGPSTWSFTPILAGSSPVLQTKFCRCLPVAQENGLSNREREFDSPHRHHFRAVVKLNITVPSEDTILGLNPSGSTIKFWAFGEIG